MTDVRKEREFEAHLVVDSEAHTSEQLTEMVGVRADEAWDKGASFTLRGKERKYTFSRWAVVESDGDIEDWRTTVERLIRRLRGMEPAFRRLPPSVRVALTMFVTEDNDVFGFGLDKDQVEFLGSIGAEIDMSFVVSCPAPRDEGTSG